ncbi:hypothetical protein BC938DRAFT_471445 [Jimgerdemannia flammicorona]|uniref:Uncharacterized protein n=1 Tax=Jimgerdemannia flammicorona TaxID=994334 RepID=A0A433QUK9_9FUNG|nr:hypothetical protein BC938DRAFT_471445 [Jimgerdemannia flammicorona]
MTDWTAIPLDIGHHHHDPQGAAIPIDSNENDSLRHQLDNLNSVLDSLTTRLYDGQAELRKTTQLLHDKYHMLAESHSFLRSLSATFSLNQNHDAIWNDRGKNQGRKRKRPDPSWRLVPLLQALEAGRGDVQENSEEEEEEEGEENQEEETVDLKVVTAEVWDRGEYEDVRWVRLRVKNCGSYPLHSLHLYLHHADPRLAPRCYRHNTIPHLQPGQDATLTASVGHCTSGEKSMGLICRYRCRVEAGGSENAAVEQQRVEEEEGEAGIWKSADVKEVVWRGGAEVKNDIVRGDWRIGLSLGLVEGEQYRGFSAILHHSHGRPDATIAGKLALIVCSSKLVAN